MYHDVVSLDDGDASGYRGRAAASYKVDIRAFERHLEMIARRIDTPPTTFRATADVVSRHPWTLTFDDGGVSASTHVAGMLEARGWRGIFFVTTDRIGTPGFLTEDQIFDLHTRGHAIGSHTHSHPVRLSEQTDDEISSEWRLSVAKLSAIIGTPTRLASVPNGVWSRRVVAEAAGSGITVVFTSDPTRYVMSHSECLVVGRYPIRSTTDAAAAAGIAAGDRLPRYRQWLEWKFKAAAKRATGDHYRQLRRWRFREMSRSEPKS